MIEKIASLRKLPRPANSILLITLLLDACGGGGDSPPATNTSSGGGTPQSYVVGGTVSGLSGTGLVLQNNKSQSVTVNAAGNFSFPAGFTAGQSYYVTVATQPSSGQSCSVTGGATGSVGTTNVSSVQVVCPAAAPSLPPPTLSIAEYSVTNLDGVIVNGGDGNLWGFTSTWSASSNWSNGLAKITPAGIVTNTAIQGSFATTPEPIAPPIAAPDGNLWFSQLSATMSSSSTLSLGSISLSPASLGVSATPFTLTNSARFFDASRNLWYAGAAPSLGIGSVNFSGAPGPTPTPAFSGYPVGMAVGRDGSVWFTVQTTVSLGPDGSPLLDTNGKQIPAGGVIGQVTPTGTISTYPLPVHSDNVLPDGTTPEGSLPTAIALGSDGNMWFAEDSQPTQRIGMITSTTSPTIAEYTVTGSTGYVLSPYLAVGVDGNMWFSVWDDEVGYITPAGQIAVSTVPTADAWPSSLTTGPDGRMWFTEPADLAANGKVGAVSITVPTAPNDNIANATALSGTAGFLFTNNVNASAEAGDPVTSGNIPKKTLWWSWTAPANTPTSSYLVIRTNGSSYGTVVGIYTGTQLANLQSVGSSSSTLIGPGVTTAVCTPMPVQAGTNYNIIVDGYNGATGVLLMDWRLETSCPM